MKPIRNMTQAELAAYVQAHLRKRGITVTLSGGAAVSIYTSNQYISADIDLVNDNLADRKKINTAMLEIGFRESNRFFVHPDSKHFVEFPPGPLSVGDEPIREIIKIRYPTGILKVISPTECVKDRLSSFYFWDDRQSLDLAVSVARHRRVNLNEIKRWSKSIGQAEKLKVFLEKARSGR